MPIKYTIKTKNPLVLLVYGHGEMSVNDINSFNQFLNTHLQGVKPFKLFFDLRDAKTASMKAIKSMVSYMISIEDKTPDKIIASSILVNSTFETFLNILFNFRKPLTPTKITSDIVEACAYLDEH